MEAGGMPEADPLYERLRRMYAKYPSEKAMDIYDLLRDARRISEEQFLKVLKELEDEE